MVNYNAYVHSTRAFGGKPKRYREVQADFHGHVAELLAKATSQNKLDRRVDQGREGRPAAGAALLGRAGQELRIQEERQIASKLRGYRRRSGRRAELRCRSIPSPCRCSELFKSDMWISVIAGQDL